MLTVSGTANAALLRTSTPGKTDWQARDGYGVITGVDSLQATGRGVVYEEKGKQHKGNWKSKCELPSMLSCIQEKLHRYIHDSRVNFSVSYFFRGKESPGELRELDTTRLDL